MLAQKHSNEVHTEEVTVNRYSIRVGRSTSPRGPFIDRAGIDLVKGGGTVVYGSNGHVYAPGGQGILRDGDVDILYYHYCTLTCAYRLESSNERAVNRSVGYAFNVSSTCINRQTYFLENVLLTLIDNMVRTLAWDTTSSNTTLTAGRWQYKNH